jgi:hypothetical protein
METDEGVGAEAGQTVPHCHFHVIPRLGKEGDARDQSEIGDAERKNLALGEGPRVKLEDAEGTEVSEVIKLALGREIQMLKEDGEIGVTGNSNELHVTLTGGGLKL